MYVVIDHEGCQVDGPFVFATEAEQRAANWEDSTGSFHCAIPAPTVDRLQIQSSRRHAWICSRALGILAPWER